MKHANRNHNAKNFKRIHCVSFLIIAVAGFIIFAPADRAEASVPTHCTIPLSFECFSKSTLDVAAKAAADGILNQTVNQIKGWVTGNGGANVGMVRNFEDLFRKIANQRSNEFLSKLGSINTPNQQFLQQALGNQYDYTRLRPQLECQINPDPDGWSAFLKQILDPACNPIDAYTIAQTNKSAAERAAIEAAKQNIQANKGYQGVQQPVQKCEIIVDDYGEEVPNCYTEYVTETPGNLIADLFSKASGISLDKPLSVQTFDQLISGLVSGFVNSIISDAVLPVHE